MEDQDCNGEAGGSRLYAPRHRHCFYVACRPTSDGRDASREEESPADGRVGRCAVDWAVTGDDGCDQEADEQPEVGGGHVVTERSQQPGNVALDERAGDEFHNDVAPEHWVAEVVERSTGMFLQPVHRQRS